MIFRVKKVGVYIHHRLLLRNRFCSGVFTLEHFYFKYYLVLRNNVCTFVLMKAIKTEKRVLKGYKIRDSIYKKAMKRAKKEKLSLSTTIEDWVDSYSKGYSVGINDFIPPNNLAIKS